MSWSISHRYTCTGAKFLRLHVVTFYLPSVFGWCIWIWTDFLRLVDWMYARGLLAVCVWQAWACKAGRQSEVCGRPGLEGRYTHTQTYTHLYVACWDRRRNVSHSVTATGFSLSFPSSDFYLNSYVYINQNETQSAYNSHALSVKTAETAMRLI